MRYDLFQNFEIALKIISPVHIGVGSEQTWEQGIDYFLDRGKIHVVDAKYLYKELLKEPNSRGGTLLDTYSEYLMRGQRDKIDSLVRGAGIDLEEIAKHSFEFWDSKGPKQILPQLRSGNGNLILPGSSIKGAIRSAIYTYLYRMIIRDGEDDQTEKRLIGTFGSSIMRFIRPADAEFEISELVDIYILNLFKSRGEWYSDYKDMSLITLETLPVGLVSRSPMRLSIASGFAEVIEKVQMDLLPTHLRKIIPKEEPLAHLFGIINRHTKRHLEKELEFFQTYNEAEDLDKVTEELTGLIRYTEKGSTSCLLRVGWGSGYHSITGDWRFYDHLETIQRPDRNNMIYSQTTKRKEPARYKSRRLAEKNLGEYYGPMGFVELSLV